MNCDNKAISVSILLSILFCSICLPGVRAQQTANSARFGASASRSGSGASTSTAVRGGGSSGVSSWGAGKGSFGNSAQPGGVWRDGSTLGTPSGGARDTTQARTAAVSSPLAGGGPAAGSVSPKPTGARGSPTSGTAHLSSSSSIGRSMRKTSSMSRAASSSQGRGRSQGHRAGSEKRRRSSGLATTVPHYGLTNGSAVGSPLHTGVDTRMGK
jgi:hypothetical protein